MNTDIIMIIDYCLTEYKNQTGKDPTTIICSESINNLIVNEIVRNFGTFIVPLYFGIDIKLDKTIYGFNIE